jgi:hypothetical protein
MIASGVINGILWRELPATCLESKLEMRCCEIAVQAFDCEHRKMNGMGKRDWPDRLFLFAHGHSVFVEFKRFGESPTPKQAKMHKRLRKLGHIVLVIDRVEQFVKMVLRI